MSNLCFVQIHFHFICLKNPTLNLNKSQFLRWDKCQFSCHIKNWIFDILILDLTSIWICKLPFCPFNKNSMIYLLAFFLKTSKLKFYLNANVFFLLYSVPQIVFVLWLMSKDYSILAKTRQVCIVCQYLSDTKWVF